MTKLRIGHGYDVHKLVDGRKLILGGVDVPHTLGLLGHSDADVLLHAIMDALLGAVCGGDIGAHFPDTSEEWRGASSLHLLALVRGYLKSVGATVVNVDATIVIQRPKIAPYIEAMRNNIAFALAVDPSQISVKATTEEHLGFTGREEGVCAHAVALVELA